MPQFDPEQYFASRLSNMQPKPTALTDDVTFNKLNAIQTAVQDKQSQLLEKALPYLQQQQELEDNKIMTPDLAATPGVGSRQV